MLVKEAISRLLVYLSPKTLKGKVLEHPWLQLLKTWLLLKNVKGLAWLVMITWLPDYLITYYEMNGFIDEGESKSNHGDSIWYNMVWENPEG